MSARSRKREAVAALRAIAVEHGVGVQRRSADMSAAGFAGRCRTFFSKHPSVRAGSLPESQRRFRDMPMACEEHINAEYAIGDLCRCLPERLRELVEAQGGRLCP